MKKVANCIICGSIKLKRFNAQCAPFLAKRIFNSAPFNVELLFCNSCGFAFYNPRLDEDEMGKLYNGYRNSKYQQEREKYEPNYTKEFNDLLGTDLNEIDIRKKSIVSFLSDKINFKSINTILDYGGDRGQYIIDEFESSEKYVYDIANGSLATGVKRIEILDSNNNKKFDFIMCCHVLEHASNPNDILKRIIDCSDIHTDFYFEVPMDSPLVCAGFFVRFFSSHNNVYNLYCKIRRKEKNIFFIMHEHVNHFSKSSLTKLLENNDFKVKNIEIREIQSAIPTQVLSCYASRKPRV